MHQLSLLDDTDSGSFYKNVREPEVSELPADGLYRACFFTGHRRLPETELPTLLQRLRSSVLYLHSKGVTDFYAGGAIGFDTVAAAQIIDLRREHSDIRLFLELPFLNQSDRWDENQKRYYDFILSQADATHYARKDTVLSPSQARNLLLKRNRAMVDKCHYGIAYYSGTPVGGTAYTVRYAKEHDRELVEITE